MSEHKIEQAISVSVPDACRLIGASRSVVYELLGQRKIVGVKLGRRTLISVPSLRAYIAGLPPASIKPPPEKKRRATAP
jgi:excisionase family DNA binding protein